jgi:hypothetical protein
MLQGNSKTQNIFPFRNIFVPVQTDKIKARRCGQEATQRVQSLIVGNIYTDLTLIYRKTLKFLF